MERFDGIYSDAKWIEGKTAKKNSSGNRTVKATPGPANVYEILEGAPDPAISTKGPADNDLQRLLTSVNEFVSDDEEDETEELDSSTTLADTEPDEDANRDSYYHMEFRYIFMSRWWKKKLIFSVQTTQTRLLHQEDGVPQG